MNFRVLLRGLVVIASLVAIGLLFDHLQLSKTWIDTQIRGQGTAGYLLFVAACALFTGIGLPRQVISFLGGYAFGFVEGTALAVLATAIGCSGTFFYARLVGRKMVASRFAHKIQKIDAFLHDNPFSMTLLIRLLPVGSNLITNLAAGVSSVRAVPFILGSAIGYIPQNLVFALGGSGITLDPEIRITLSVALFMVSGAIGVFLYRRYRHGKSFDDDVDTELGTLDSGLDMADHTKSQTNTE